MAQVEICMSISRQSATRENELIERLKQYTPAIIQIPRNSYGKTKSNGRNRERERDYRGHIAGKTFQHLQKLLLSGQ